ncbi:MAG: cupin-like domain-containing protein [Coxiellaceae bacterium]|nr:cupin-like domain-containing protein [Coxiellaceae bacterium]
MNKSDDHIQHNLSLLRLDPEDEVTCALMYTLRNQFECIDFMRAYEKQLTAKMLQRYHDNCIDYHPEDYQYDVPIYDINEVTADDFKEMICQSAVPPFVIRGFLKQSDAVKKWSLDYFAKHYADAEVAYLVEYQKGGAEDFPDGKLGEVIAKMRPGYPDKAYVHNTSEIFISNPELLDDLDYQKLTKYYSPAAANAIVQMFIGGADTGVRMHCATDFNSFLMVHGNKHWTFVPPEYTYALRPILNSSALNALCGIKDHKLPFEEYEKTIPLYNRIPKYSVLLEPGDMLLFSPWWWHAVDNTSPNSIAVATRWTPIKAKKAPRGNVIFSNIQASNPSFVAYSKKYLLSLISGELVSDKGILRDTFGRYHGDFYEDDD